MSSCRLLLNVLSFSKSKITPRTIFWNPHFHLLPLHWSGLLLIAYRRCIWSSRINIFWVPCFPFSDQVVLPISSSLTIKPPDGLPATPSPNHWHPLTLYYNLLELRLVKWFPLNSKTSVIVNNRCDRASNNLFIITVGIIYINWIDPTCAIMKGLAGGWILFLLSSVHWS